MLYSIRWERVIPPKEPGRPFTPHIIHIKTTFLDEEGQLVEHVRCYEEWLGVCTSHIDRVVALIQRHFPKCRVRYLYLQDTRKILPYFESRLRSGKLEATPKPFYKVYVDNTSVHDVGRLLQKNKISYYAKDDWLVRLYIDLGLKFKTQGFYYKWYTVNNASPWLLHSFHMHPEVTTPPDWTIAAFDLETVPMDGSERVPTGEDPSDEIVMVSLYKWNKRDGLQKFLLYRTPCPVQQKIEMENAIHFESEADMLQALHKHFKECQVLTGYNINGFDIPCLFSRLTWLGLHKILKDYSSKTVGTNLITTYQHKLVLDLYHYFRVFSNYDLPGFKLDDVARKKLNETKDAVNPTGIWYWYTQSPTEHLVHSDHLEECFDALKPKRLSLHQFGTFKAYMRYCLKDSHLVYQLFQKEMVLYFFVERANFTGWDASQAMYMGNSSFLLELFKTYGTLLGFFINTHIMKSPVEAERYQNLYLNKGLKKTYQGALNFCLSGQHFENVSVLDFASMYPSTLVSSNLCYSTCAILTRDELKKCPTSDALTIIPYRKHGDADFHKDMEPMETFHYPTFDPAKDTHAIVVNMKAIAFLPTLVTHFIKLRKEHQRMYKETGNVYHYNAQLCIKILINSLYGVMANKDSPLYYLPIPMSIVDLSREQLLGLYHYLKQRGYLTCYLDTDSAMVEEWLNNHCDAINAFLNLPHVELKFEQRMSRLLILSRKRYVYQTQKNDIVLKGFQKRSNELVTFLTELVLNNVWHFIFNTPLQPREEAIPENVWSNMWMEPGLSLESRGWLLWVELIQKSHYKCRQVDKYSIYRKTKHLHEYKSKNCAAVRMLEKNPELENDYIEYTYSRADVASREASKWVMDVSECQQVNYEQLFMSQKKIFCTLLNMAFWKRDQVPTKECDLVLNNFRWKQFMHVELLHFMATKRRIMMLVETGTRYTFCINDHQVKKKTRGRKRKRKDELKMKL